MDAGLRCFLQYEFECFFGGTALSICSLVLNHRFSAVLIRIGFTKPFDLKAWQHEAVNGIMLNCLLVTMLACVSFLQKNKLALLWVNLICTVLSIIDSFC